MFLLFALTGVLFAGGTGRGGGLQKLLQTAQESNSLVLLQQIECLAQLIYPLPQRR